MSDDYTDGEERIIAVDTADEDALVVDDEANDAVVLPDEDEDSNFNLYDGGLTEEGEYSY